MIIIFIMPLWKKNIRRNEQSDTNETLFLHKSTLTEGLSVLLEGMRLWNQAMVDGVCVHRMLGPMFSRKGCLNCIRYIDEMQCLLSSSFGRRPKINLGDDNQLSPDEVVILKAAGLIEIGKLSEASRSLHGITRGPLNFTLMRILFDLVNIFKENDLTLGSKPDLSLVVS